MRIEHKAAYQDCQYGSVHFQGDIIKSKSDITIKRISQY